MNLDAYTRLCLCVLCYAYFIYEYLRVYLNAPLREVFQMQFLYDETTRTSSGSLKALLAFDSCALRYGTPVSAVCWIC